MSPGDPKFFLASLFTKNEFTDNLYLKIFLKKLKGRKEEGREGKRSKKEGREGGRKDGRERDQKPSISWCVPVKFLLRQQKM